MKKYVCTVCGYIYDEAAGDPDNGVEPGTKQPRPKYLAPEPSSSSMRSSWLYLATRSVRLGAPVLIWPAFNATERSAMVVSSVSPER